MKRFFEILPGASAWLTLIILVLFSWRLPTAVVIFIVLYDLYWLLRVVYLFFHLQHSFFILKANLKIDWFEKLKTDFDKRWEGIYHLVILPAYQEPYEVVAASFQSFCETNYPKDKIIIVLAIEERGGIQDQIIAERIKNEFGNQFFKFLITIHPADLPREIPGKGSNETWAAKEAKKLIDSLGISYEDVIVSVFDIDSRPGRDYFAILTYKFFETPNRQQASYQPIPLFTNNLHKTNVFARLIGFSSSFWQFMQQARPYRMVSFSSHSIPFKALVEVGFWPTDIVSEDSQIFFKLLDYYNGNWQAVPLFYPVYMDAVVGDTFWEAVKNIYKQQRRWAWGVENFVFVATEFLKNKKANLFKRIYWFYHTFTGFYSWATNSFIIFFFGWLPNVIGGGNFQATIASYNLSRITGWLMNGSVIGIILIAFLSILLLPPRLPWFKKHHYIFYFYQWFLLPPTFILFAALPALDALTRMMLGGRFRLGFWKTPKK